jgi:hypothetical protein
MRDLDRLAQECDYDTKLAVTAWVFKHILAHATDRGSFRGLIYERRGFGSDAYVPLYEAGGLDISDEFGIPASQGVRRLAREHKIAPLKMVLRFCDVPECFEDGNCDWPSDTGYRLACNQHKEVTS